MTIAPTPPASTMPFPTLPEPLRALVRLLAREAARVDFATRFTEQEKEASYG